MTRVSHYSTALAIGISVCLFFIFAGTVHAASSICYAVASGTWNTPSLWASSSGGTGGTCAAGGGSGLEVMGTSTTISAGVPGASSSQDRAIINSGIVIHIDAGVGVDLGENSYNSPADSLTINASNSSDYGALIVDKGGLVRLHGGSSSGDNYAKIAQYAVLQVMPGGALWFGTAQNAPAISVLGRLYVGCGDQSTYPTPFCSGDAGAWVTPSVSSSLNFTAASSLPAGLSVGDLVELSPTPQSLSTPYPYDIDGVTPPLDPPIMPTTDDTGTSPMKTCGSASSCKVPRDQLLCVVAVNGNAVSLGWPEGGTTAEPYCTGTETAISITNAGKGELWLKEPAFFWGDPMRYTWDNSSTFSPSSQYEQLDGERSGIWISKGGPISNASGTGPGRYGDNSLDITSDNWGAPCSFLSMDAVTSSGCYVDYDSGFIVAHGYFLPFTGSMTYMHPSNLVQVVGAVNIPSGSRSFNEMVFDNADLRYIYPGTSGDAAFIEFSHLSNTANNRMAFVGNTVSMSRDEVGVDGLQLTSGTPLQINGNSFGSAEESQDYYSLPHVDFTASSSYVDMSNNFADDWTGLFGCSLDSGGPSSAQTFDHVAAANNQIVGVYFNVADNYYTCNWTNFRAVDNRITSNGSSDVIGGYAVAFQTMDSNTPDANNLFTDNYVYGDYRGFFAGTGERWTDNYFAFNWHHVGTVSSYDSQFNGGEISGLKIDHNVFASDSWQVLPCLDTGYNQWEFIDGLQYYNNTCLVTDNNSTSSGGVEIGDSDGGSNSAIAGLQVYNNIFGPPNSLVKTSQGQPNFEQNETTYAGWNTTQGTNQMYLGFASNPSNVPNPEMYGTAYVTQDGLGYNTSTVRNITGVAIQNPTYTTTTSGCLKYNYTDQSDITMQWSTDCVNYGAAVQLNWAGADTTFTSNGTPTASGASNMIVTVGSTPFTAMPHDGTGDVATSTPLSRWVWAMNGTEAGDAYAITSVPGTTGQATGELAVSPQDTALGTATFSIINWEIRLYDASSSNSIDIGVDARDLPRFSTSTTLIDSGITLTPEDYCDSSAGCARPAVVAGLATTFTSGSNLPLVPVAMPILGGSAEEALCNGASGCGGTSYYLPSGDAWLTASDDNEYLGAIAPLDTGAPSISITSPSNNDTVKGTVSISALSTDDTAISGVQFKINGANLGSMVTATSSADTYSTSWDTSTSTDGTYMITAIVHDSVGNTSSDSVTVSVDNSTHTSTSTTSGGITVTVGAGGGGGAPSSITSIASLTPASTASSTASSTAAGTPSIASLQSEIAALQAQLSSLLAEAQGLNSGAGSGTGIGVSFNFMKNLRLHDTGSDVIPLQRFLNANGFKLVSTGPGSPGEETSIFGILTYRAVVRFQAAHDLPQTGFFGPLTRAAANDL